MANNRILLQWIGHSDLRAMAADLPKAKQRKVMAMVGGSLSSEATLGPTKCLLDQQSFEYVVLLSTYAPEFNQWYANWLQHSVQMVAVQLDQVTDYGQIFQVSDQQLRLIRETKKWSDAELCLHLSPGTPAMAAVLLLLGKTRYPATFYETSRDGRVWLTNVPFELLDIIPDVLHKPDSYLQHLASQSPSEIAGFEHIIGNSPAIRDAVGRAKRAAIRSISVLLLGESGTGKEMFAQAIHNASPRRDKPFKAINCAALSKTLLESELFGHAKGAFTGAERDRKGAFEAANGGTIFLDEVGECDLETQAKLLRVLQPITGEGASVRKFCRLGEEKDRKVNVRVVAATNRDLHKAISEGLFREDLYYRLAAVTITLPPLRERGGDIGQIAQRLLQQVNEQFAAEEPGYEPKSFASTATAFIKQHHWPGNVRQLYNAIVQTAVLTDGSKLGRRELEAALGEIRSSNVTADIGMQADFEDGFSLDDHLKTIQRTYLQRAMEEAGGVKAEAARLLGYTNWQTLDAQLKRFKIKSN